MNVTDSARGRIASSLVLTTFLAFFAGCGTGDEQGPSPGVRDEVYVQVMTELLLLDSSPPAGSTLEEREARADSARGEILASHGVTAQEMLDFARVVGSDAGRMEGLWHSITQRYDSTRVADLRRDTEARSEAEGKLGEEARAGAVESTPPAGGEVTGKPTPAGPRGSGVRDRLLRSAGDSVRRPAKTVPSSRDTTVRPGR